MGYMTIKQDDGKLAVWSTVVDDFVAQDLTVDEVLKVYEKADVRAAATNLAFAWSKLSPEHQEEEVRKFLVEASAGLREEVEAIAAGTPREGDYSWGEAKKVRRACHGGRR
jgi:hypothetical protein